MKAFTKRGGRPVAATLAILASAIAGCSTHALDEDTAYRLADNSIQAAEKKQACRKSGRISITNGATVGRPEQVVCVSRDGYRRFMQSLTTDVAAFQP